MTGRVVGQLVRKDLFLLRWTILGTSAAGLSAVALLPMGKLTGYLGGVLLVCALIILNIVIALHGIAQERRERMLLFVLSLPVSPLEYTLAKVSAASIAFGVPWLLLTAATVALIMATPIPDGLLPFWLATLGYLLFYFCALLALTLVKDESSWHTAGITIGNISVNILIPVLLNLPSITMHIEGPRAVWATDVLILIAAEIALGPVVLALAVRHHARRGDFV
jgi:ABC-2 type transport system permease protein